MKKRIYVKREKNREGLRIFLDKGKKIGYRSVKHLFNSTL